MCRIKEDEISPQRCWKNIELVVAKNTGITGEDRLVIREEENYKLCRIRCASSDKIPVMVYVKKLSETEVETRVAYEVSVSKLECINE